MNIEILNIKRTKSVNSLLKEGKNLFWKYGISRVTVDEICREADVSKMTFYRSFENKYELARIILIEFANESYALFTELFSRNVPFPDMIKDFIELKRTMAKSVSMEFMKDLYNNNEFLSSLKAVLEDSQKKLMTIVFQSFERAREEGWIYPHMSTPFIMYMFEKVGEMSEDENLVNMFSSTEELTTALTNFLFHGLIRPQKKEDE